MARPSLGPNYGVTDRRTPAQLLGGMAQASDSGAIAQRELGIPALQAVSQLVETFSQPGQGPTLGGPAQVPTPPGVPQAQAPIISPLARPMEVPNPIVQQSMVMAPSYAPFVDNMGALARSLKAFTSEGGALDSITKLAADMDKRADERAKSKGSAFAQEASQLGIGGFLSLQDLQKRLEKGVAEGAAGYEDLLKRFQAKDPRSLRYALVQMQTAAMDTAIATAPERWIRTKTLLDGRPRESAGADDPEVQRSLTALMFPQGTANILPEVWQSRQQQVSAAYSGMMATQEKHYAGHKTRDAKRGLAAANDAAATEMVSGSVAPEITAGKVSGSVNGFYEESGQTTEEYQKEKEQLVPNLVDAVIVAAGGDYQKLMQGRVNLVKVLRRLEVGPMRPDGTRPLLFDEDGYAGWLRALEKIDRRLLEIQELNDKVDRRAGLETADAVIGQLFTPEVLASPELIVQATDQAKAYGIKEFGEGTEKFLAFMERVNAFAKGVDESQLAPLQREAGFQLELEMARNPDMDFTERIDRARTARVISDSDARSLMRQQASRNDQKNRLNYDHLKTLDADLNARLTANAMRGDGLVDPEEFKEIQQARMALRRRGVDMIIRAQGADITEQLSGVWSKGVEAAIKEAAKNPVQTREPATPQEIRKGLYPGARGSRNQNEALKRRIETERVFTRESLLQEIGNLDAGKPLSNEMKEIIRRSGLRPSEALLNQMRMHGIEVPPEVQQNLQKLDGGDLVSQARPAAQPNRFLGLATNLSNRLATGLVNTLVPPAQARGTAPFTGSPSVPVGRGSKQQAVARAAQQLGIDPVHLAAVMSLETGGTFNPGIVGGQGGNYRGLIQFGPSERRTYGYRDGMTFEDQVMGPVVRYLKSRGVKPGHGAQEIYAAILTGNVANIKKGGLDWKDSFGTSVRKALPSLTKGGHYQNAVRFLRGN